MSDLDAPPADDWRPFGLAVQERRKALGLLQEDVAAQIGAAPSWVSQVENGTKPSAKRADALELVLGPEIRNARPDLGTTAAASPAPADAVAFPLLWRARADMLDNIGNLASSAPQRRRLEGLAAELTALAAAHPAGSAYTDRGGLLGLYPLSGESPSWLSRVVLAEIACMKLDAPYEMGVSKRAVRLQRVDRIVADLRLPEDTSPNLNKAIEGFNAKRSRPLWQNLPSIGGSRGRMQIYASTADGWDMELLVGHDPVGWLGFEYAAGRWLLHGAPGAIPAVPEPDIASAGSKRMGAKTVGAVAAGGGAAMLLSGFSLGPVLGAATLVGLAAARRSARSRAAVPEPPRERVFVADSSGEPPLELDERLNAELVADMAESLTRTWVRVEACKLVALYSILPNPAQGDPEAGLPPNDVAARYLTWVANVVRDRFMREVSESGTDDFDANDRLRQLADIRDTLIAASARLSGTTPPKSRIPRKR